MTASTLLAPVVPTHRLVALPVKGDAFLLVRRDKPVLVDGGGNGAELYKELQAELPDGIHIGRIICTHNDADHANGLAQLLEDDISYPMTVDEVWLPGSWADPIDTLVKSDGLSSLIDLIMSVECCKEQFRHDRKSPLKQLFDAVLKGQATINTFNPAMPEKKSITTEETAELEKTARTLREVMLMTLNSDRNQQSKQLPCMDAKLIQKAVSQGGILPAGTDLEKTVASNLIQYLVEAGTRIHTIATAAVKRGALIRWFDADQYYKEWPRKAKGGDTDLIPLNSKEEGINKFV